MQKKSNRLPPTSTFHIYFGVDTEFSSKAIKTSEDIGGNYSSEFIIGGKSYVPHITLYIFAAPIRNIPFMVNKLESISEKISPPELSVARLIISWDGWLMLQFKGGNDITRYHNKIIEAINPLREGILRKKYRQAKELNRYPKEDIVMLKKYGERHAGEGFHPHLSLARIKNIDEAKEAYEIYKNTLTGEKVRIVSLDFIRVIGDETGGVGEMLYKKEFNK